MSVMFHVDSFQIQNNSFAKNDGIEEMRNGGSFPDHNMFLLNTQPLGMT